MKSINVQRIISLNDFSQQLTKHNIDCVNWPEDYPYKPEVYFQIASTPSHLCVNFFVTEKHILGRYLNDNDPVWTDSCVELFIKQAEGKHYYNFEINCIGTILAAKRESKEDAQHFTSEQISTISVISSLPREQINRMDNDEQWSVMIAIPYELLGLSLAPESLDVNLYKCGDETQTPHFVSWNKIDTATPNFHLPEFFGRIYIDK